MDEILTENQANMILAFGMRKHGCLDQLTPFRYFVYKHDLETATRIARANYDWFIRSGFNVEHILRKLRDGSGELWTIVFDGNGIRFYKSYDVKVTHGNYTKLVGYNEKGEKIVDKEFSGERWQDFLKN